MIAGEFLLWLRVNALNRASWTLNVFVLFVKLLGFWGPVPTVDFDLFSHISYNFYFEISYRL